MALTQAGTMQNKWAQTGWRIEQKYGNKVLLGNWADERLQFTREPKAANSTNRVDYQPHWDVKPDVFERGSALLRAEGLPSKLLLAHHGQPPSSDYLVTHYEESYGRRQPKALPTLRPRRPDRLTWQLERSDQPISEPLQSTEYHLGKQPSNLPSLSEHRSVYQKHPLSAFCQRCFARSSRTLSSHLHAANRINKDLDLRQCPLLQVPDSCFMSTPTSS